MKPKNMIVINFLKNLKKYGFITTGSNSVLHLPTGHVISYSNVNFFGDIDITEDSSDEEIENSEMIIVKVDSNEVRINYLDVIDFYIEEYAKRYALIEGGDFVSSFKDMRRHLEFKFTQAGYEPEED